MAKINYKQRRENELYWLARAAEHSDIYLADAEKVADTLGLAYFNAFKQFEEAAQNIFKNFQTAFNLSEAEARQLLEKYYGEKPSQAIAKAVNDITDEEQKLRLQAEMSAPAYQYRIKRLDTLAAEGKKLCETLYKVEVATNTAFLAAEYEKAYNLCTFDIQKGTGVSVAFEHVPKSRIDQVLKTNWSGKHFSTRVWDNTQELAQELSHVMAESFMTGESGPKTAQKLQERFSVGAYEARRLIRTENTYITGQAELESYEKSKIKEYKYAALMDKRTSDVCKELNGKIFPLSEAQAGKNYPPMHPFCRSSSIPIVPTYEELVAKEKKILEQIPDDMTFDEWLDSLEPTKDGMLEFKPKKKGKSVDISGESGISETVKSAFVPAKNIKEAQEYAEKLGVKYADYSKFPLERANNMNMALSTLPDDATPLMVTDLQKFSKVTGAPLGRAQKNGYAVTASPYEINPSVVGSSDARLEGSGETIIAVNTRNFKTLDSLTESKREYNEKYENLKGCRWHFNMEGKMTDFHECGHVYEKKYGLPTGFIADAERWRKETKLGLLKSDREAWAEAYGAYYTHRDDLPDYIREYFDEGEAKTVSGSKVLSFEEWQKKIGISIDKTAKGGIIKLSSKFVNSNEKLYRYADKIKPEKGFSDIVCHGTPNNLLINGLDGEEWSYNAKQAAEMIRNSQEFKGTDIRLISCQAGAGDNSIAQLIADELGVNVKAPTEIVNVSPDGNIFVSDNETLAYMWYNGENVAETGKWVVFKPRKR